MERANMYMRARAHTHIGEWGIIIETHILCRTRPTSGQIKPDAEMKSVLVENAELRLEEEREKLMRLV